MKTVIFSHGFGVQKDDRGLFTAIARELGPDIRSVMFDYNRFDASSNTLIVAPFTDQVAKLKAVIAAEPADEHYLVCHSQGCVVAGLAGPAGFRKIILLAPPITLDTARTLRRFGERPGAKVDLEGESSFPRRDGSTTMVPAEHWRSRQGVEPVALYNQLAESTAVLAVQAAQDEVLEHEADIANLDPRISKLTIPADHDFTRAARSEVIAIVKSAVEAS